jgi:hypothetical protein
MVIMGGKIAGQQMFTRVSYNPSVNNVDVSSESFVCTMANSFLCCQILLNRDTQLKGL